MKQNLDDAVSLFPFLDIMACLIGILVLLITAVVLAQISQNVEEVAGQRSAAEAQRMAHRYRQLAQQVDADREKLEELQEQLREAEEVKAELEQVLAQLEQLETEQEEQIEQQRELLAEKREELEQLELQIAELREQQSELLAQMAELETVPDPHVRIVPSGTGYHLTPTFIECTGDSLVVHRDGQLEPVELPVRGLSSNETFLALLERVREQPRGTIVFLLRPDGIATYNTAHNLARRNYVPNGKLAVAGYGEIDLSLFQPGGAP